MSETRSETPRSYRKNGKAAYETAGPEQLARQPSKPRKRPKDEDWTYVSAHLNARFTMLMAWRYSWMTHYELLEAYILPRRGIFINPSMPTPNAMQRGMVVNQNIIDPTGTQAMRICAAGLMSGLMSPGRPWFRIKPAMIARDSVDGATARWFEEVEDRIYQVLSRSNFYDMGAQMFEDLTVFGTGPMLIYEDDEDVIRCYLPCPGEYYLAVGPDGRINGFFRMFVWTVAQIVEFFGLENCPEDVQGLWATKGGSLDVEKIVAHAIEPNFPIDARNGLGDVGVIEGGFTWRENYWVWGSSTNYPMSSRGFHEAPHVVPRWATTSNDPYGRSVGMDVLQDIMQLQEETRRKAEAIQKLVRPPMLADASLKNEPASGVPGGITYVAGLGPDKGMRPIYTVNPQIKEMMEDLAAIQQRVKTGFFNDLFLMIAEAGKDMTAYEVAQRQQEKLQVLGPVTERWQNEFAAPAVQRVFRIMERKGLLPPLPEALVGMPLGVEFVSPLAMAQKTASTTAMERYAQVTGNLTGVYPEARAMMKPAAFLREYGNLIGVPASVMGDEKDVAAFMENLAKQQQQAQMAAGAQQAVEGAQTLSQTDISGQNALALMLGNAGQV